MSISAQDFSLALLDIDYIVDEDINHCLLKLIS